MSGKPRTKSPAAPKLEELPALQEVEAMRARITSGKRAKGTRKTVYLVPVPIVGRISKKPISREEFVGEVRRSRVPLKFVIPEGCPKLKSEQIWKEIGDAWRDLLLMGGVARVEVLTHNEDWNLNISAVHEGD
jgi:hypothetical protein